MARTSQLGGFDPGASPTVSESAARTAARTDMDQRLPGVGARVLSSELQVFVPQLVQSEGTVRRVWVVTLAGAGPESNERILVDAADGDIVLTLPLHAEALWRLIEDTNGGTNNSQFMVVRTEGQGPAALAEANSIYDDLGATWSFYWNQLGRDSYDAAGDTLRGVARYCGFGDSHSSCANASFSNTDTMSPNPAYQANAHLLISSSGWMDLFFTLRQAAVNLGWSETDQNNLYRACKAVEIDYWRDVWADASSSCPESGAPFCLGTAGPAHTLGHAASLARPGDRVLMLSGTYHEGAATVSKILSVEASGGTVTIGP